MKTTKPDPIQYTVRGVSTELDRELRKRAAGRNRSLNQVILDELSESASHHPKRSDFSDLVGKWVPDPAFDEILASQRSIEPDEWK